MVALPAVFWDHPEFNDEAYVRLFLSRHRGTPTYLWALARFLEHGRFVDTVRFFSLEEIREKVDKVRISPYARKRWSRFLEVYA